MRNIIYLLLILSTTIGCGADEDKVIISKQEYDMLKGDTIKPEYPKTIFIINSPKYATKSFDVYLGSDGHEYQLHTELHIESQWIHYGGCKKCVKKDSL